MNTMDFTVERGYRPPVRSAAGRPLSYPWPSMAVGDSFFYALPALDPVIANRVVTSGNSWGHRNAGEKFVLRWQDEPKSGYRVWRIA
jgi:hypothetical protein